MIWVGTAFQDKEGKKVIFSSKELEIAQEILNSILRDDGHKKFKLDPALKNEVNSEPRFAANTTDGIFIINPLEWVALDYRYDSETAERMRMMFAVHEIISQPEIGIEATSYFPISSALVDKNLANEVEQKLSSLSKGAFPKSDLSLLYSCEAELWKKIDGDEIKVWRSPFPLRTYLKWALQENDIADINGKKILMNPNFVPGASGACYSFSLDTLGFRQNREALLYRESENSLLDICGVISDASYNSIGSIEVVMRRVDTSDPLNWHKYNYLNKRGAPNSTINGKGETTFTFENYKLKMRCDQADKI